MEERRKSRRLPATMSLEILNLYKQDNVQVSDLNAPIEVINISREGIGFISESVLPMGYYFNANISLGDNGDTLHTVVEIIRSQALEDKKTLYGCEFVGMATVLGYIFDEYEEKIDQSAEE